MSAPGLRRALAPAWLCAVLVLGAATAQADAGWFESGDTQLRLDLQLLNDAGIIRYPLNQWPIPREGIRVAMDNAKSYFASNAAVASALARVQARVAPERRKKFAFGGTAILGEAPLLRDFDSLGRENAELRGTAAFDTDRFAATLNLAGVTDPDDGDELRLDGSHATLALGNWLVSANTLERFWGPSHESSLILSNNARPMPTIMVERAAAIPFETRWLSWLGPWRMNFGISQMENTRQDVSSPLFMAWRFVVMPFRKIEFGFSRTAQFCGQGQECNLDVFGNLIAGNDNVGIDARPEDEPGNQMAGFDIRWTSPIGDLPYAIYSQMIGEDESSYLPVKYLNQFGLEVWRPRRDGGLMQWFAEYSATTCSATSSRGPYYNCAYTQGRFSVEGYRYKGRVLGHTADNDAEIYTLGGHFTSATGKLWSATARYGRLNQDGIDERNTVSPEPADYGALELAWRGKLLGEQISVEAGVESVEPDAGTRDVNPFGFVRWQHDF